MQSNTRRTEAPDRRHVSLYRKWRPRTFGAVAGQEPVVRTLKRAIETDRVAHAYLFSGPRGTGKTSTAKVLAMGLNCEKGPTPEPDGTCAACRGVINNTSVDVLEMDAASNRGIDEIRDLRDKVNLSPVGGRTKVYIIDEVHMLTTEAFNALLKMLEEPPSHVVFVLATTEKHKVPATIVSRCQSFDFRRPGVALLAEKLGEIAAAEGIEAEPAALTLIAREGGGSFRDAEGLLDQLSSFAEGPITASMVRELLGSTGSEVLVETTDALYENRAADALRVVDRLQNEGRDLPRFATELIAHLRRLMLLPHAPEVALAEVGEDEREGLEAQADRLTTAWVVRAISALDDTAARSRRGGDAKLELELTFLGLTRGYVEPSVDALLERIEALEKALENGAAASSPPTTESATREQPAAVTPPLEAAPPTPEASVNTSGAGDATGEGTTVASAGSERPRRGSEEENAPVPESGLSEPEPTATGDDTNAGASGAAPELPGWGSIMAELKRRRKALTAAVYQEARVGGFDGETLHLVYPKEQAFYVGMARDAKHAEELGKILEERLGRRPRLEFEVGEAGVGPAAVGSDAADAAPPLPPRVAHPEDGREPDEAPSLRAVPEPRRSGPSEAAPQGRPDARSSPVEVGAAAPREGGAAADDVVRSQGEVFELAREWNAKTEG
jgi:DNA polymerase-3 subunit gamma/tau